MMKFINHFLIYAIVAINLRKGLCDSKCNCNFNFVDVSNKLTTIDLGTPFTVGTYSAIKGNCDTKELNQCINDCKTLYPNKPNQKSSIDPRMIAMFLYIMPMRTDPNSQLKNGQLFCDRFGLNVENKNVVLNARLVCDNGESLKSETGMLSSQTMSCINGTFISGPIISPNTKPNPNSKALICSCGLGVMDSPGLEKIDLNFISYRMSSATNYDNSWKCNSTTFNDCTKKCAYLQSGESINLIAKNYEKMRMPSMCGPTQNPQIPTIGQDICDALMINVNKRYVGMKAMVSCDDGNSFNQFTKTKSMQKMSCVNRRFIAGNIA